MCLNSFNKINFLFHSVCHSLLSTSWWKFFVMIWKCTTIKHFDCQKRTVQFNRNCLLPCPCNGWQGVNGKILKKSMASAKATFIIFEASLWMRSFVAQPYKYGYQIHRTLKACSVLLCSLRPLHHCQSWEDVSEPWMVWLYLLTLPQLQRERTYWRITQVTTSMTV